MPHFLPSQNPFLADLRARYGLPENAPTGGADTMFPEFMKKLHTDNEWTKGTRKGLIGSGF